MTSKQYSVFLTALKDLINDYGLEIFSQESKSKLLRVASSWPDDISDYRDEFLLLCIKNIPQRFFEVFEEPGDKKQACFEDSVSVLTKKFGIEKERAKALVSNIAPLFNMMLPGGFSLFTDDRDGSVYKCKKIGGQFWMVENFRFEIDGCLYPDGDECNMAKYGCLYNWQQAKSLAPKGWHLPSKGEWDELVSFIRLNSAVSDVAPLLKSREGWKEQVDGCHLGTLGFLWGRSEKNTRANGSDDFDFCALPSGAMPYMGSMGLGFGYRTAFWELDSIDNEEAYGFCIDSSSAVDFHRKLVVRDYISVRYVKDYE